MNAISAFKNILKYIDKYLEENQHKEERHIDEFCDTVAEFTDEYSDKYSELDNVFSEDYGFRVDRKSDIMDYFNQQILPIDYSDYEDIDHFMKNVNDCGEWCYVDLVNNKIEKWNDVAKVFVEDAKTVIEDVYERNFNKDVEMEL